MSHINKPEIIIKPLKKIQLDDGDVLHALKSSESEFHGFNEAYFSCIKPKASKMPSKFGSKNQSKIQKNNEKNVSENMLAFNIDF